jgi:mono/diheme cytochrome c family protein
MAAALVALSACGSGGEKAARPTSTTLPLFEEMVPPTVPAIIATAAATSTVGLIDTSALNPTAVARGASSWDRLECATCHGTAGEGGAGAIDNIQAPSLLNLELTEDEFIDWMRSGGSLGSKHQYSTDRLSDSGGRNLYQYLLSLRAGQ